ncbi:MAG TPA: glycosyltransferase family 4 protein [Candidatus Paceibacterota bacterium]|nr:glycosyltransferase family 4 protein [Candidatus Paceibacterota bacterium]
MNIAIFSETIDVTNGHGNITYELCRALHARGVSFTLFLPRDEKVFGAYPFPVRRELPSYIFRVYTPKALPHFFGSVDLAGFDLVHCLLAFPHSFFAMRMAKKYKLPFLMGGQGTFAVLPLTYPLERRMLLASYRAAKEIMVPSEFTKAKILEYAKSPVAPISIVHNGVNFSRFEKEPDLSALRARYAGKKVLLTVGGLKRRKGQDIVLRALPEVLKRHPDARYVLVGSGDKQEWLESIARELGVAEAVEFVGQKTGEDLVRYFYLADVYVHTPRVNNLNFEGFGIVYLEAGACGKPSVATDAGGIRDAVLDGQTGLVAADGDVAGVASAINRLLDDPMLAKRLGEAGKAYAREHDWDAIAAQFIERYERYIP